MNNKNNKWITATIFLIAVLSIFVGMQIGKKIERDNQNKIWESMAQGKQLLIVEEDKVKDLNIKISLCQKALYNVTKEMERCVNES